MTSSAEKPVHKRLDLFSNVAILPDGSERGMSYSGKKGVDVADERCETRDRNEIRLALEQRSSEIAGLIKNAFDHDDIKIDRTAGRPSYAVVRRDYLHPALIKAAQLRAEDLDESGNPVSNFAKVLRCRIADELATSPLMREVDIDDKESALVVVDIVMATVRAIVAGINGDQEESTRILAGIGFPTAWEEETV